MSTNAKILLERLQNSFAVESLSTLSECSLEILQSVGPDLPLTHPLRRLTGKVVVIKYGGSFMDGDSGHSKLVLGDILKLQALGALPVIVHGGGKAITSALERAGVKTHFLKGQRVTDALSIEIVDRVLSHEISPSIVAQIAS